jgi:hypothetical protein
MSFRYPYVAVPTTRRVVALGGRSQRPRPLLTVAIINPRDTTQWHRYRGCLDTGSDDTVFHDDTARLLGIDLARAATGQAEGTTGTRVTLRYSDVLLQLRGPDGDLLQWQATVAFAPKRTSYPLLGFAGFLQYFHATFFGDSEEFELIPNSRLHGLSPLKLP